MQCRRLVLLELSRSFIILLLVSPEASYFHRISVVVLDSVLIIDLMNRMAEQFSSSS